MKQGPRERLLEAAQRLSYTEGVNVGVDALLKGANVARRSLYEHFGGKDGLIAEMLQRTSEADLARYRDVMDAAGAEPKARLLAVFDDLDAIVCSPDFRGCRYLGADLALAAVDHPAHAVTGDYRKRLHGLLRSEVERLDHPNPARAADQLLLLIEGVLATGATRPGVQSGRVARELAELILRGVS